jgi:O-antigen/teichoic acid export membrane protein
MFDTKLEARIAGGRRMNAASHSAGRGHASRDVAIQISARVLNLALGVVVTALVARALGDAGFGQWSTILVVVQLAAYFTSFGVESVVVREATDEPEREDEWLGALLILRALLSVPAILVGLVVLLLIEESTAMLVAGVVLLAQTPFNVGSSLRVVHQLRVRNWVPMVVLTLNSVLWGVAVVVIYLRSGGLVPLAVAMTATAALTATVQAVAAMKISRPNLRPSRAAAVRLARIGLPVGIAGLLVMAYARIDQLIVFAIGGSTEAGLYGAAYRIVEQAHLVPVSLMTTLMPIMVGAWRVDRERMERIAWLAAEYLSIGSLGGLAVAIVVARPFTVLLYGQDFADAAPALPVLGAAFVFICFGYLTGNLLLIAGMQRRMVTVGLVGLVINVAGNLLLVPAVGFMGAAWMTLLTEAVVVGTTAWMLHREIGLRRPALGRMMRIAIAAAALGLGLAALREWGLPLAGLLATAAIAYPALLFALRALDLAEVRVLLRDRAAASASADQ